MPTKGAAALATMTQNKVFPDTTNAPQTSATIQHLDSWPRPAFRPCPSRLEQYPIRFDRSGDRLIG